MIDRDFELLMDEWEATQKTDPGKVQHTLPGSVAMKQRLLTDPVFDTSIPYQETDK